MSEKMAETMIVRKETMRAMEIAVAAPVPEMVVSEIVAAVVVPETTTARKIAAVVPVPEIIVRRIAAVAVVTASMGIRSRTR